MFSNSFINSLSSANEELRKQEVSRKATLGGSVSSRADGINYDVINIWEITPASPFVQTEGRKRDWKGRWLYLAKHGTSPGARIRVSFSGGAKYVVMSPGSYVKGDFEGAVLVNDANQASVTEFPAGQIYPQAGTPSGGAVNGQARFVYGNDVDALYAETAADDYFCTYPNFAVYTPAYNAAAFAVGNVPVANTDGLDITGCKAVRAYVSAYTAGATITSCSFRWWVWSPIVAAYRNNAGLGGVGWAPSTELIPAPIATASREVWALPDYELGVRVGRVYLECITWVDSTAGVGNRQVYLEAA